MSIFFTDVREFPLGTYFAQNWARDTWENDLDNIWAHTDNAFDILTAGGSPPEQSGQQLYMQSAFTSRHANAIWTRPGLLNNTVQEASVAWVSVWVGRLEQKTDTSCA